jgi:hypothetical protein
MQQLNAGIFTIRASMKLLIACAILALLFPLPSLAAEEKMTCETGPLVKKFGGTMWEVFSCDVPNNFIVVSQKGNPAAPFMFISIVNGNKRHLTGHGNGSKEASNAAMEELKGYTEPQFQLLLAETRNVKK